MKYFKLKKHQNDVNELFVHVNLRLSRVFFR